MTAVSSRAGEAAPAGPLLCIETSCDDTSAAVVDGREVLSSVVSSQNELHAQFGGVVPEVASRRHTELVNDVVAEALAEAGAGWDDLAGVASTQGPGLIGALLVGLAAAKAIAYRRRLPLIPVNHLQGHIAANYALGVEAPFVCLVASGGHTLLAVVEEGVRYRVAAKTLDDAAGEAFDKVGKLLGLAYPAGAVIERLSARASADLDFPRPLMDGSLNFSFSGLKTAVLNYVRQHSVQSPGQDLQPGQTPLADVCGSFQRAAVEVLVAKTLEAARRERVGQVILAGGVAANQTLRRSLQEALGRAGVELLAPALSLCTDNAAMVAAAGFFEAAAGRRAGWDVDAVSRF